MSKNYSLSAKFIRQVKVTKLQAMHDIIQSKVNAMRDPVTNESPYKRTNKDAKAIAWDILIQDLLLVSDNIHNASLGYVDVEAIRLKVFRSL
jgi:hypothetical protein